jgi:phosphoribosylpyrophosphate synthetase
VLAEGAWDRLARAGVAELFVTDSVVVAAHDAPRTRVVTVAPVLAAAIERAVARRDGAGAHCAAGPAGEALRGPDRERV